MIPGRNVQVATPMRPPMRNVMAASWKGGTWPDAAVNAASTAHRGGALTPMSVAVVRDKEPSVNGIARRGGELPAPRKLCQGRVEFPPPTRGRVRKSHHILPAIGAEHGAGDEAGLIRCKE